MIKLVLLLALSLLITYSFEQCDCGTSNSFNSDTNTCEKYPGPKQEGFIEGCLHYIVDGNQQNLQWKCASCKAQYLLNNNYCIDTRIPGCVSAQKKIQEKIYSDGEYQCKSCDKNGYYLDNFTCYRNPIQGQQNYIQGCIIYRRLNQCLKCQKGFFLNNSQQCQEVLYEIPYCEEYGEKQNCLTCQDGYLLKDDGNCVKFSDEIKNCRYAQKHQNDIRCNSCEYGYYNNFNDNSCQPYPTSKKDGKIDHCLDYFLNGQSLSCLRCEIGYSLSHDKKSCVVFQGQTVDFCGQYFQSHVNKNQQCQFCQYGYRPIKDKKHNIIQCQQCPVNPELLVNSIQQEEIGFIMSFQKQIQRFIQKF